MLPRILTVRTYSTLTSTTNSRRHFLNRPFPADSREGGPSAGLSSHKAGNLTALSTFQGPPAAFISAPITASPMRWFLWPPDARRSLRGPDNRERLACLRSSLRASPCRYSLEPPPLPTVYPGPASTLLSATSTRPRFPRVNAISSASQHRNVRIYPLSRR